MEYMVSYESTEIENEYDFFIVEADTFEEIKEKAKEILNKRKGKNPAYWEHIER